jgi:TusA-related sulfurtransferase
MDCSFIDATSKSCKGVIAALEGAMPAMQKGSEVKVKVSGIPDKIDVYAWAKRKGHRVASEDKNGTLYVLGIIKG